MSHRGSSNNPHASKPTFIEYKHQRFLLMDAPSDDNASQYISLLQQHDVSVLVRACDPCYDPTPFENAGIQVKELPFTDGEAPPKEIVAQWIQLIRAHFGSDKNRTVAVHCVAGLGRTPVLVAIALIEAGMDSLDAIDLIRKKRRGAINKRQLEFLEAYKPSSSLGCCAIV
jgi:protein tyrosine phosphatase type IVA